VFGDTSRLQDGRSAVTAVIQDSVTVNSARALPKTMLLKAMSNELIIVSLTNCSFAQ